MVTERKSIYADRTFYQKSGGKSYLVIRSGEEPELPYQINMIRYNKISGLLPIQFFIEDGEYRYFYDISCMESLAERMKQKKYGIKEIRTIMSDLYRCVQQLEEYLLDTDCLILDPEYMFSEKGTLDIQFCFYQDKCESFEKSLERLFDYFMNQLDYQDEKTVLLVYSLYQKSREEHTPFSDLMKQFCEVQSPVTEMKRSLHHKDVMGINGESMDNSEIESERNITLSVGRQCGENVVIHKRKMIKQKKEMFQRWIPYIPDLIGGYGIARILWYISRNYMQLPGKIVMFWMFAVAGILAGCGCISTFLSRYLQTKVEKMQEEQQAVLQNGKISKLENRESEEENNAERVEREPVDEMEENVFEEFNFQEEMEEEYQSDQHVPTHTEKGRDFRKIDSVPATVVMSEPELFRAFNPVLVSRNRAKYEDIILKERTLVIGKVRGIADVCLEGRGISRVHARISQDQKGCSITDLGSTNGTFINGNRLQERQRRYLEKGDEVRFAEAVYEFLPAEIENVRSHQISDVI